MCVVYHDHFQLMFFKKHVIKALTSIRTIISHVYHTFEFMKTDINTSLYGNVLNINLFTFGDHNHDCNGKFI